MIYWNIYNGMIYNINGCYIISTAANTLTAQNVVTNNEPWSLPVERKDIITVSVTV